MTAEGGAVDGGPAEDRVPVHVRQIELRVYEEGDRLEVVARLRDDRPWASATPEVEHVHEMTLEVAVRRTDASIVSARAEMQRFPHVECTQIEGAFAGLVGLNVTRGYNRAVQERFGRALGCTHLEFLARAVGPVVIQAVTSVNARRRAALAAGSEQTEIGAPGGPSDDEGPAAPAPSGLAWLADTCHVWASGGVGQQKLELGWRPGLTGYPAPSVVELRRRPPVGQPPDES